MRRVQRRVRQVHVNDQVVIAVLVEPGGDGLAEHGCDRVGRGVGRGIREAARAGEGGHQVAAGRDQAVGIGAVGEFGDQGRSDAAGVAGGPGEDIRIAPHEAGVTFLSIGRVGDGGGTRGRVAAVEELAVLAVPVGAVAGVGSAAHVDRGAVDVDGRAEDFDRAAGPAAAAAAQAAGPAGPAIPAAAAVCTRLIACIVIIGDHLAAGAGVPGGAGLEALTVAAACVNLRTGAHDHATVGHQREDAAAAAAHAAHAAGAPYAAVTAVTARRAGRRAVLLLGAGAAAAAAATATAAAASTAAAATSATAIAARERYAAIGEAAAARVRDAAARALRRRYRPGHPTGRCCRRNQRSIYRRGPNPRYGGAPP